MSRLQIPCHSASHLRERLWETLWRIVDKGSDTGAEAPGAGVETGWGGRPEAARPTPGCYSAETSTVSSGSTPANRWTFTLCVPTERIGSVRCTS